MRLLAASLLLMTLLLTAPATRADQLTQIIQEDLAALGYDVGVANGEMSGETAIAISTFQAENNLEVTGETSPQLAGVIKATLKNSTQLATGSAAAPDDAATLQAAQQACLQQKMAEAQEKKKKKRGLGRLTSAITRTASRLAGGSTAQQIAQTSYDIFAVDATANDLEAAAKDLGLAEDDIEACRNP